MGLSGSDRLAGNSDGTMLGNVGDSLKVTAMPLSLTVTPKTYSATIAALAVASSATDVFTISGSGTKTVRILSLHISGTRTSAGFIDFFILKRSTANSGGTSTARTAVSHDSTDSAATATVLAYTANPTLGTLVGNMYSTKYFISSNASSAPGEKAGIELSDFFGKQVILRGTGEVLSINLNAITIAGSSFNISVTWTEE
jgi:hypothetical protein